MATTYRSNEQVRKLFDSILRKTSIRPPIEIGKGKDLIGDFSAKCEKFKETLRDYIVDNNDWLASRVKNRLKTIQSLQDGITECLECYLSGDIKSAYDSFELMLKPKYIFQQIENICIPLRQVCNKKTPLYRVRKSDIPLSTRKDIFHIPFTHRHLVKAQRYSVAGLPCLYLGTSLYICWREMDKPDFDKLYISAFITASDDDNSLLLNLSADFIYKISLRFRKKGEPTPTEEYSVDTMLSYLTLWPLIIACNYLKEHSDASFMQEYIVPNLLMQWISRDINSNNIIGIAYRSTKLLANTDSEKGINIVIPPKVRYEDMKGYEFCPELSELFEFTPPVSWQILKSLDYVPLRQSLSDREALSAKMRRFKKWGLSGNLDDDILNFYQLSDFYKLETCIDEIQMYDNIDAK